LRLASGAGAPAILACGLVAFIGCGFPFRLPELKQAGLSVAVIKFDFLEDHYVTILSVTDREVVAGDPLNGLVTYSYDDFAKVWRFSGVVLGRLR